MNEIVKAESKPITVLQHFDDMQRIAKMAIASQLVLNGESGSREELIAKATMCIMTGFELGLRPAEALRSIIVVKGRTTFSAGFMAARIKASGKYTYAVQKHDDTICSVSFYEKIDNKMVQIGISTFTIDDARKAGLVKPGGAYEKNPSDMMFARAISRGARRFCPDLFMGAAYTPEDMQGDIIEGEVIEVEESEETPVEATAEVVAEDKAEAPKAAKPVKSEADMFGGF